MVHDPKSDITIIILTNLAAVPATGEGSALVILKVVIPVLYGSTAGIPGDPAAVPATTPSKSL
jgi:D-alanyl-D-alanine carboxypeptidase